MRRQGWGGKSGGAVMVKWEGGGRRVSSWGMGRERRGKAGEGRKK